MLIYPKTYLVVVATGCYDDYIENVIFVTNDKDKADSWVTRYNKIIDDNLDRIREFPIQDPENDEPFWYWLINYQDPFAKVIESEYRS